MRIERICDCHFHDTVIKDVTYSGGIFRLSICEARYEDAYSYVDVDFRLCKDDLRFYYFHRYPRDGIVKYDGSEVTLSYVREMLKQGKVLEIDNVLQEVDSALVRFECSVFPYLTEAGELESIVFELSDVQEGLFIPSSG